MSKIRVPVIPSINRYKLDQYFDNSFSSKEMFKQRTSLQVGEISTRLELYLKACSEPVEFNPVKLENRCTVILPFINRYKLDQYFDNSISSKEMFKHRTSLQVGEISTRLELYLKVPSEPVEFNLVKLETSRTVDPSPALSVLWFKPIWQ